ncbi:MAG: DUF3307 domain-containing protein [Bacteroidales bacterium]|nr:DUF3307 domain-containing protein [Bacteroidales bacterium]
MWYLVFNLLVAHIICDFHLQTDGFCKRKKAVNLKGKEIYLHTLTVFVLSWMAVWTLEAWWLALGIAAAHLLTDALKNRVSNRSDGRKEVYWFTVDQMAHVIVIIGAAYLWTCYHEWQEFEWVTYEVRGWALIALGLMLAGKPSNVLVSLLLRLCKIDNLSERDENGDETKRNDGFHSGRLIGTMERWLMIGLILLSQYEAIGFLIAAKSILRFNQTNEPEKSEYVVAGTFVSLAIALAIGLALVGLAR